MSSNVVKKTDNKLKKINVVTHSCFFSRNMLLDIDFFLAFPRTNERVFKPSHYNKNLS